MMPTTNTLPRLAAGTRLTGPARETVPDRLVARYQDVVTVRELAEETGRPYGFVHYHRRDSGVLRGHRGPARRDRLMDGCVYRLRDYARPPTDVDLNDVARMDASRLAVLRRAQRGLSRHSNDLVIANGRRIGAHLALAVVDLMREGHLKAVSSGTTPNQVELTESGRAELARLEKENAQKLAAGPSPAVAEAPTQTKERPMWPQWVLVAFVALVFVGRLISCCQDRPNPHGTDAQQRERAER
jgi:hypothetical protein